MSAISISEEEYTSLHEEIGQLVARVETLEALLRIGTAREAEARAEKRGMRIALLAADKLIDDWLVLDLCDFEAKYGADCTADALSELEGLRSESSNKSLKQPGHE